MFATRLKCEISTPFILPVVPDEKQMVLGVSLALLPPRSNGGSGLLVVERMSLGNWGMDGTLLRTVKT